MAVPILLAVVSIMLGMSLLLLAAAFGDFHTITPILAVMIGLGVAIDYALFIVMRFRQELAKGKTPVDAAVTAGSTAGRAVIFAGRPSRSRSRASRSSGSRSSPRWATARRSP